MARKLKRQRAASPRKTEKPAVRHFLLQWRELRGLKQQPLADRSGVTHGTISKLENGKVQLTEERIFRLADGLRIKPGDLFRSPLDQNHIWALAERIEKLPPVQRDTAARLVDALIAVAENTDG